MKVNSSLAQDVSDPDRDHSFEFHPALWNGAAPKALRKLTGSPDEAQAWRRWAKHLARRRRPLPLAKRFLGSHPPLVWAWPDELTTDPPDPQGPLGQAHGSSEPPVQPDSPAAAARWLERMQAACDTTGALEALAWAYQLPALAAELPAAKWWRVWRRLVALAEQSGGIDLEAQPLVNQLLAGELPWVLADQFPELKPCHELRAAGSAALERGIAELLDGEGLPQARHLAIFRPLVAVWTRSRAIGGRQTWDQDTEKQFSQAVLELARLSRADGSQALSSGPSGAWSAKLVRQALRLVDSRRLSRRAGKLLPLSEKKAKRPARPDADAAVRGDWAELAVLQTGWQRGGPKLTVAYDDRVCRLELEVGGQIIWSGPWRCEVVAAGKPLAIQSDWEEVCWVSDDDVDYLEIEAQLSDGFLVQRQFALARQDRLLYLADAVAPPAESAGDFAQTPPTPRINYTGTLPLAEGISVEPARETREVALLARKQRLAVLPLALPEWRSDVHRGELSGEAGGLVLRQVAATRSIYAPLAIDLDRRRWRRGLTWRQLTVAENRQLQSADVAVGFRAQFGRDQWLFYRSLVAPASRTVLGQNLGTEFLFGRFQRDGSVERLVEIE